MQTELIDSFIDTLNANWQLERKERELVLQEQICHNRKMENIESKKAQVLVYDSIEKRISLFLSSQKVYNELKSTMSLEQIAQAMPSCIKCFDFSSMKEEDQKICNLL